MDFKEKTNLSTKNSISGKVVLNSEGEIKTFPDKEFLVNRFVFSLKSTAS